MDTLTKPAELANFFAPFAASGGTVVGTTGEFSLSQYDVDLYGALIEDLDPMHNQSDWPPGLERWGGPIVIGNHILSMAPQLMSDAGMPVFNPNVDFKLRNVSKVRFISPMAVGHPWHAEIKASNAHQVDNRWNVDVAITVHPQGTDRPFMYAEIGCTFTMGGGSQ